MCHAIHYETSKGISVAACRYNVSRVTISGKTHYTRLYSSSRDESPCAFIKRVSVIAISSGSGRNCSRKSPAPLPAGGLWRLLQLQLHFQLQARKSHFAPSIASLLPRIQSYQLHE